MYTSCVNWILWESSIDYAAGHLPGEFRKYFVLYFKDGVWNWRTHFATQYVVYMSSDRCQVSCWQQPLECKCNAKPQKWEEDARYWASCFWHSDNVLAQTIAYLFQLGYKNQISCANFCFQVYCNMVEENRMCQQAQVFDSTIDRDVVLTKKGVRTHQKT